MKIKSFAAVTIITVAMLCSAGFASAQTANNSASIAARGRGSIVDAAIAGAAGGRCNQFVSSEL